MAEVAICCVCDTTHRSDVNTAALNNIFGVQRDGLEMVYSTITYSRKRICAKCIHAIQYSTLPKEVKREVTSKKVQY